MSSITTDNPRLLFQSTYPEGYNGKYIQVSAEVVFGSPSKNCDGYGVCMLTSRKDIFPVVSTCNITPCTVIRHRDRQELVLAVDKKNLSKQIADKFLKNGQHFLVEESYPLSLSFLRKVGLGTRMCILAGSYRIREQKSQWQITLQLMPMGKKPNRGIRDAVEALRVLKKNDRVEK